MVDFIRKARYNYEDLCQIVSILRGENGCPWDREQTHRSIRRNFLEEAYEACEGIDLDDPALMQEEFGDVLLQVVFHADIEKDLGRFTIDDVTDTVCKKLIYRHPHVFSDMANEDWDYEQIKKQEKGATTQAQLMDSVARSLPSLIRAEKIQKKAQKGGCMWTSVEEAADCARKALNAFEKTRSAKDLGRALFAIVGAALENDCETALADTCEAFIRSYEERELADSVPQSPASLLNV